MDVKDYFEKKYTYYPDAPANSDFVAQVDGIIRHFPQDSFVVKWIKVEAENQVYCQVIISNKDYRRDIVYTIEEHFSAGLDAIEAYIVTEDSIAILPFDSRNGTEIPRPSSAFGC